jgi:tetratricopeptide (TPR) repeat protein
MSAVTQPSERRIRGKAGGVVLLLLLASVAGYAWWSPIQKEREEQALENASIEELQRITAQRPKDARAFYYLGLRLQRARQKGPSFDALSRAAALDRNDEQIWIAAAGTSNGFQGPHASFLVMDDFLKRHPNSLKMKDERDSLLTSLQRAADGFAEKKSYEEAIRFYRLWLDEEPGAVRAQQGLAGALQAQGKALQAQGKKKGRKLPKPRSLPNPGP